MCPYFLSRDDMIMIESQLVLMPYNYIMDRYIRKKLPFDLHHCVVIIDEAHNIVRKPRVRHPQDSFCLESMSFDINAKLLHDIQKEIRELLTSRVAEKMASLEGEDKPEEKAIIDQQVAP